MKYSIVSMVGLVFLFGLAACSAPKKLSTYPYYEMAREYASAQYCFLEPKSIEDIARSSTTVVKGIIGDDTHVQADSDEEYASRYNLVSLQVTQSLKGDLQEGDTIQICEGYYVKEEENKPVLVLYGNYMPSESGQEYLFFLNKYAPNTEWANVYSPTQIEMGRYPVVSGKTRSGETVASLAIEELYLATDDLIYRELYQEAMEQYM